MFSTRTASRIEQPPFDFTFTGMSAISSTHGRKANVDSVSETWSKLMVDLPRDSLLHIMSFLLPDDIVKLRLCNRKLYSVSCERTVWINSIRRICLDRGLFLPTFPVEEMSLVCLQHAATSPSRFTTLLCHHTHASAGSIRPIARRVLAPHPIPQSSTHGADDSFAHLCLVPGGRWLITHTERNLIQLWDLGLRADTMIKPSPLTTMDLGEDAIVQFPPDVQTSGDGKALLVAMSYNQRFLIFEIYPTSPAPSFDSIAVLDDLDCNGTCAFMFTSEILAFFYGAGKSVLIWNFLDNTWVKWDVRRPIVDMAISDLDMILVDHHEISVWRIPPLQPRVPGVEPLVESQKPLICVPYSLPGILRIALNPSWYLAVPSHDSWSVYFDVLHTVDEHNGRLARYVLKTVNVPPESGLPRCIPVLKEQSNLVDISTRSAGSALSVRTGSDDIFLLWREGNFFFMHISVPDVPPPLIAPICGPRPRHSSYGYMACCPASGRICTICWDGHVNVMDYLMPP